MPLLDIKDIKAKARKELQDEATEVATEKLKTLYTREEKAALALANIRREIAMYEQEVSELATYEAAGVDTTKS